MTLKVTQGHRNCCYLIGHVSLPIVVCSNNDLHRFQDITTLTVYVSTWLPLTLRSPSVSKRQLKLQAMCAFRFMCKHIVVNICCILWVMHLQRFQTGHSGNWYRRHSIDHTGFPVSLPLQLCRYLASFPRHYQLFPKT